jgi:hypothetical protein
MHRAIRNREPPILLPRQLLRGIRLQPDFAASSWEPASAAGNPQFPTDAIASRTEAHRFVIAAKSMSLPVASFPAHNLLALLLAVLDLA